MQRRCKRWHTAAVSGRSSSSTCPEKKSVSSGMGTRELAANGSAAAPTGSQFGSSTLSSSEANLGGRLHAVGRAFRVAASGASPLSEAARVSSDGGAVDGDNAASAGVGSACAGSTACGSSGEAQGGERRAVAARAVAEAVAEAEVEVEEAKVEAEVEAEATEAVKLGAAIVVSATVGSAVAPSPLPAEELPRGGDLILDVAAPAVPEPGEAGRGPGALKYSSRSACSIGLLALAFGLATAPPGPLLPAPSRPSASLCIGVGAMCSSAAPLPASAFAFASASTSAPATAPASALASGPLGASAAAARLSVRLAKKARSSSGRKGGGGGAPRASSLPISSIQLSRRSVELRDWSKTKPFSLKNLVYACREQSPR